MPSSEAAQLFAQAQQVLSLTSSNNYQNAITLLHQAFTLFEKEDDLEGKEKCLQEIALCHMMNGNYAVAKEMYHNSLYLFAEKNDIILPGINDDQPRKTIQDDEEGDTSETFITNR